MARSPRRAWYRAGQVLDGAHRPDASGFADLTDLPAPLREALDTAFRFSTIVDSHIIGADGGMTAKAVHELADGQRIESVLMRYPARGAMSERTTICISSQAGCAVNCPFCATGQAGFGRQLTPGEIVDQVLHWHRPPWNALGDATSGHYNIVFMGMGEPLNNADRVFEAVRLLNDPARLGIGARHITVSTSGVVPGMDRMVDELPQGRTTAVFLTICVMTFWMLAIGSRPGELLTNRIILGSRWADPWWFLKSTMAEIGAFSL